MENKRLKERCYLLEDRLLQESALVKQLFRKIEALKEQLATEKKDNLPRYIESEYEMVKVENENLKEALTNSQAKNERAICELNMAKERMFAIEHELFSSRKKSEVVVEVKEEATVDINFVRLREFLHYTLRRLEITFDLPIGKLGNSVDEYISRLNTVNDKIVFDNKQTVFKPIKEDVEQKKSLVKNLRKAREEKEAAMYTPRTEMSVKKKKAKVTSLFTASLASPTKRSVRKAATPKVNVGKKNVFKSAKVKKKKEIPMLVL